MCSSVLVQNVGKCVVVEGTDNTPVVSCGKANLKYQGGALPGCPAGK